MTQITKSDGRNIVAALQSLNPGKVEGAVERARLLAGLSPGELADFQRAVMNVDVTTITISADLQRVALLTEAVRAFATRLLPLRLFSTVFQDVPLQGTDEIVVPYFSLQGTASSSWSAADGYVFDSAVSPGAKKITVSARKYQPLDYGSETFQRQPAFRAGLPMLAKLNAEKLAADVFNDVWSAVTATNFGAAALTTAAATITSDDIVTLMGACNDAHWPDAGRGLIVDSSVNTALQKDEAYKLALNIGGSEVVRGGKLPMLSGFALAMVPSLPDNSENLIGCAVFPSALLIGFAPVDPTPEVRRTLSAYEIVTDPQTGVSMNFRSWGDPDLDRSKSIIEVSYGYVKGEAAALKRICSP